MCHWRLLIFSPQIHTLPEGADPCKSGYFSIDSPSGNAHYPRVSRDTPHQSLSWTILTESALPVIRAGREPRSCPILVDAEGDRHANSPSTNEVSHDPQARTEDPSSPRCRSIHRHPHYSDRPGRVRPTHWPRAALRAVPSSRESLADGRIGQRIVATKFASVPARGDLRLWRGRPIFSSSRGYERRRQARPSRGQLRLQYSGHSAEQRQRYLPDGGNLRLRRANPRFRRSWESSPRGATGGRSEWLRRQQRLFRFG